MATVVFAFHPEQHCPISGESLTDSCAVVTAKSVAECHAWADQLFGQRWNALGAKVPPLLRIHARLMFPPDADPPPS